MQSELTTTLQSPISNLGQWFAANQARLIATLTLLVIGVLLAFLLRAIVVRALRAIEGAFPGRGFRISFGGAGRERHVSDIVGAIVFWAVLLFFIATAVNALGLPLLSAVIDGLSRYVPRILAAALIMVIGIVIANIARGTVMAGAAATGAAFAPALGQIVRFAILIAAALIASAELGVNIGLLTAIFSVALAALLGGFALAFGLGARTAISNIIGSHYLRQTFEVGQTVRLGGIEGTIASLTPTAVVLHVAEGRMIIPARQFDEMPSLLVVKGAGA